MLLQPFHNWHGFVPTGRPTMWRRGAMREAVNPVHVAIGAAAGAGLAYFLDPDRGKRRRIIARDRSLALMRRIGRQLGRRGRKVTSDLQGQWQHVTHGGQRTEDVGLGARPADLRPLEQVPDFHGAEFRGTSEREISEFEGRRAA